MSFENRVAIITGAGGGLGASHAYLLAKHGAKIVVNDMNEDAALSVVETINRQGGDAIAFAASVTDESAIAEMVKTVKDRWGRIDVLVNNAGILRDKSFAKMSLEEFKTVVDVHLMGAFICTKAVWAIMREQQYGRVVMTTSSSGLYGNFGQANYGAAKMALVGLMQTLAIEGKKYNIHVNCLAPTAATAMTEGVLSKDALAVLTTNRVSPSVIALCDESAPTRTIVCAGAGNFAQANITLTQGYFIGEGENAPRDLMKAWDKIGDRKGEIIPQYGFTQAERELIAAGVSVSTTAIER